MISSEEKDRWEALISSETEFEMFGGYGPESRYDDDNNDYNNNISLFPGDNNTHNNNNNNNGNRQTTMQQLVEKNIELTENLNTALRELHEMEERALGEKRRADDTDKELQGLRDNIGTYLSNPSENKIRHQSEQKFWNKLATTETLKASEPPPYFEANPANAEIQDYPMAIAIIKGENMSGVEAEEFRARYQRALNENKKLLETNEKLKKKIETQAPIIQKLINAARKEQHTHKKHLMSSVRRIRYLQTENDEKDKKIKHLQSYVSKLETSTMRNSNSNFRYKQHEKYLVTGRGAVAREKSKKKEGEKEREQRKERERSQRAFRRFQQRPIISADNNSDVENTNAENGSEGNNKASDGGGGKSRQNNSILFDLDPPSSKSIASLYSAASQTASDNVIQKLQKEQK